MSISDIPCMLACDYMDYVGKPKHYVTGWYASVKYDGQRAFWLPHVDGGTLYSRLGNKINAPAWFVDLLNSVAPETVLDGEIFFGNGNFHMTGNLRSTKPDSAIWSRAQYKIFDAPLIDGTFEERYFALLELLDGADVSKIEAVEQIKIKNSQHLEDFYNSVLDEGGEGLILRDPSSLYVDGRSPKMLKYKPSFDNEAVIVGYNEGNGRNTGKLGSFIVHPLVNGEPNRKGEFSISGMTDYIRTNYKRTHPVGTVVTYSYRSLTNTGKPRHPVYRGIRTDVSVNTREHPQEEESTVVETVVETVESTVVETVVEKEGDDEKRESPTFSVSTESIIPSRKIISLKGLKSAKKFSPKGPTRTPAKVESRAESPPPQSPTFTVASFSSDFSHVPPNLGRTLSTAPILRPPAVPPPPQALPPQVPPPSPHSVLRAGPRSPPSGLRVPPRSLPQPAPSLPPSLPQPRPRPREIYDENSAKYPNGSTGETP
jgi:DNA ligase 1